VLEIKVKRFFIGAIGEIDSKRKQQKAGLKNYLFSIFCFAVLQYSDLVLHWQKTWGHTF
jgi:hypothetical protein